MPFNHKIYQSPARRGDVSDVAIDVAIALDAIADALQKIQDRDAADIAAELETIRDASRKVMTNFDRLTGWRADA